MANKILTLPVAVRAELDRKLRAAAYGDLVNIAAWVTEVAFPVSKSGLHRYASGLKASDAAKGGDEAQILLAVQNANRSCNGRLSGRQAELLLRLGQLEVERQRILTELAPLMVGMK